MCSELKRGGNYDFLLQRILVVYTMTYKLCMFSVFCFRWMILSPIAFVYECESTFKGTLGLKMLLLSIKYVLLF